MSEQHGPTSAELRAEIRALRSDLWAGYLSRHEWTVAHAAMDRRVSELEEWQTWAARVVLALVITAVISASAFAAVLYTMPL